jgi:hypothetical protein
MTGNVDTPTGSENHPENNARLEQATSPERRCILVLGMHRSGTSALARVLGIMGGGLPKTLMDAGEDNQAGFWESEPVRRLNDELLAAAGSSWMDWRAFDNAWKATPEAAKFRDEALAILREEFGAAPLSVLKDPRICRLAPFWLDVLRSANIRPLIVLPLRNPLEVAASLEARNDFVIERGYLIWLRHVLEAEAASRGMARFHCSYDRLMNDWRSLVAEAQKALNFTFPTALENAAPAIDAFLAGKLRHHSEPPEDIVENPALSAWLRDSFEILHRWTVTGEDPKDFAALDRIRAEFDAAVPIFAPLVFARRRAPQNSPATAKKLSDMADKLEATAKEIARLRKENAEKEAALRAAMAKSAREEAARTQTEARLRERFDEIAALSGILRENEAAMRRLIWSERWPFLPAALRIRRRMILVRRSGIFDADWYARTYADVAASGMDPLRHFVQYGGREGRAPNAVLAGAGRHREGRNVLDNP